MSASDVIKVLWFFLISISLPKNNYTLYLDYVISLNSWLLNSIFIAGLILCFGYSNYYLFSGILIAGSCTLLSFNELKFLILDKPLVVALWDGTVNIHPPLLYYSVVALTCMIFFKKNFYIKQATPVSSIMLLWLTTTSLFLGSLWGLQSIVWGYVWVGDKIEWILLSLVIYLFNKIHKSISVVNTLTSGFILQIVVTILLLVRLNFVATRHSFFVTNGVFYPNLIIIFIIFSFIFQVTKLTRNLALNNNCFFLYCFSIYIIPNVWGFTELLIKATLLYIFQYFLRKIVSMSRKINVVYLHNFIFLFSIIWITPFSFYHLIFYFAQNSLINFFIYSKALGLTYHTYTSEFYLSAILESTPFHFGDDLLRISLINLPVSYLLIFNSKNFVIFVSLIYFIKLLPSKKN